MDRPDQRAPSDQLDPLHPSRPEVLLDQEVHPDRPGQADPPYRADRLGLLDLPAPVHLVHPVRPVPHQSQEPLVDLVRRAAPSVQESPEAPSVQESPYPAAPSNLAAPEDLEAPSALGDLYLLVPEVPSVPANLYRPVPEDP